MAVFASFSATCRVVTPMFLGDAGMVYRRCGISRLTLRKCWHWYQADGVAGLQDKSRRPPHPAKQRMFTEQGALVLDLRRSRRLGIEQLSSELLRQHGLGLSFDKLHRILVLHDEQHLKRPKLPRIGKQRYSRPLPSDRVQIYFCNVVPAVLQYTALDDCSCYRVLAVYPRPTFANTLDFQERLLEDVPFPIQRIQSDRGLEFFAEKAAAHGAGRQVPADHAAVAATERQGRAVAAGRSRGVLADRRSPLARRWGRLAKWQHFWNWERPRSGLGGRTPIDRVRELLAVIPLAKPLNPLSTQPRDASASPTTP